MAQTSNIPKIIINQELSIQISLSGLSFCILQKDNNTITYLKHFDFEKKLNPFEVLDHLKHYFETEQELQTTFSSVKVIYINELSTLVPEPLFNEECIADYLKFNSKILKSDYISYDKIEANNSVNVYVPYVNINNYIYEKFGAFIYKHFSTVIIENILLEEKNSNAQRVYVHIDIDHFEILILNKGKLILYNTFEYKTKEDFIYYILFSCEQLNLDPETIELVLLGRVKKENAIYKIAYKYVRNVEIINLKINFILPEDLSENNSNYILLNSF
ncbi:DUF3822 family protein [Hyunsoonleella aestuarii]|nr:DUF3822 family protein [Hyunsoonleella aestuarii]